MKQNDFAKALTDYLSKYLPGQRNVSTNTIKSYRDTFKQFLIYMNTEYNIKPEHLTFNKITVNTIRGFLSWLENTRGVGINTRNQRLAAIHSFYRYVQIEHPEHLFECQKVLNIPYKKSHKPIIKYLTQENLLLMLAETDTKNKRGHRDLAIMTTLYDTGARVQELVDLKVCDIRLTKPATITLNGKGNKQRSVPLMTNQDANRPCQG